MKCKFDFPKKRCVEIICTKNRYDNLNIFDNNVKRNLNFVKSDEGEL